MMIISRRYVWMNYSSGIMECYARCLKDELIFSNCFKYISKSCRKFLVDNIGWNFFWMNLEEREKCGIILK